MTTQRIEAIRKAARTTTDMPILIPVDQIVDEVFASSAPEQQEHILAQLVGKVYDAAPTPIKTQLIALLMRPLGLLSLMAIANGVFAKIRSHGGWPNLMINADDTLNVASGDIVALTDFVQQISSESLNDLAQLLITTPVMAGSGAAAVLVAILLRKIQSRRSGDDSTLMLRNMV